MENNILLNEITFTQLCKFGHIKYYGIDIPITSRELMDICNGNILEKIHNGWSNDVEFKIGIDLNKETIKEILKRSPIYSELSNNF